MQQIWTSEAGRWAVLAGAALCCAMLAQLGEVRRMRRRRVDDVGFMPWGGLFLLAFAIAALSTLVALSFWLAPA
jgi:hypothetical protein